ncbi:MAG: pilus assembly protein PilM [Candidatus Pacebacteria bacterium]|nr:pilus assembly protein PilM [Candidatus Paceibacterota bacterium]MBP9840069.1 pilus assembly protein PilM [Candidatus Paceibacterota bacterium]
MAGSFARFARVNLAPPKYLSMPTFGVDVSVSGIKAALLTEHAHGLELSTYAEEILPEGAFTSAEITDTAAVIKAITEIAKKNKIRTAAIALPESRTYLFEADVVGKTPMALATAVEARIDEFVPLPPSEVAFDIVPAGKKGEETHIVGVGYARRVITQSLSVFDDAGVSVRAIESELFSMPRAVLRPGDPATVVIIDIGKTTTKLIVVANRLPRYATTLDIGGHALTQAVQKYFGVSEEEARRVKVERGLVAAGGNEDYRAAMLSTVSAIREEIARRLEYWQTKAVGEGDHEPISRAIVVGGNATVKGLPEYLAAGLKIPVELGDVFTNLAPRDKWLPSIEYNHSLAYATAIGLALRTYVP